jgi:hypothetical protein
MQGYDLAMEKQPIIAVNVNYGVPQVADLAATIVPREPVAA